MSINQDGAKTLEPTGRLENRLKKGMTLKYGVAGIGQSIAYNVFYTFFIFFLTSVAGVGAALAGTISLFAVLLDAITDPIIGRISDNFKGNKHGKRVPFMLFAAIPLGISLMLLFSDLNLGQTAKAAYFLVVNATFWIFFTMVDIPYVSMAPELSDDQDEIIKLRTSNTFFTNVGAVIIVLGVVKYIDFMEQMGQDDVLTWRIIGAVLGAITTAAYLYTALALRGKETVKPVVQEEEKIKMVPSMMKLLKLKQYWAVILIALAFNINMGVGASSSMYYFLVTCGFSYDQIAFSQVIPMIIYLLAAVPVGNMMTKTGKKWGMILGLGLMLLPKVIAIFFVPTLTSQIVRNSIEMIGNIMYWVLIYAMVYDVADIDEYKTGVKKEAVVVSLISFIMKAGVAVGMWISGIALEAVKFDPNLVEPGEPAAARSLTMINATIPAVIMACGILVCLLVYRINSKNIEALKVAVVQKAEGREYSEEEFKMLL